MSNLGQVSVLFIVNQYQYLSHLYYIYYLGDLAFIDISLRNDVINNEVNYAKVLHAHTVSDVLV